MRLRLLIPAVLLVPLVDAVILVSVAVAVLDPVTTVALVVLTALMGTLLVRAEGRRTLRRARRTLARGEVPTNELLDGALLVAAGALLITPGLVSDLLGFLFAVPLTRTPVRAALRRYVVVPYVDRRTDGFATGEVYVGGTPGDAGPDPDTGGSGVRFGTGPPPDGDGDGDAYDIDIEDVTDADAGADDTDEDDDDRPR